MLTSVPGPAVADPPAGPQIDPPVDGVPILRMKATRIVVAVEEFKNAFPNVRIFYATKCNTDPGVLRILRAAGTRFEVASVDEINTLRSLGVGGQGGGLIKTRPARPHTPPAAPARGDP